MDRRNFLACSIIGLSALSHLDIDKAYAVVNRHRYNLDISVNDKLQYLDDYTPFIDSSDRTMVPLRFISESLNATVNWRDAERIAAITYQDQTVSFPAEKSHFISKNGTVTPMDTQSIIVDGRLYLPIRYILNEFPNWQFGFTKGVTRSTVWVMDHHYASSRRPELEKKGIYPFAKSALYTYNDLVSDLNWLKRTYGDLFNISSLGKSTSGEYDIWKVTLGKGEQSITAHGAMHGNEWLNTPFLVEQCKEYAKMYTDNLSRHGENVRQLLDDITIHFIPSANPDGTALCQFGVHAFPQRAEDLYRLNNNYNPAAYDFTRWKANINGVDINRNMDTGMRIFLMKDIKAGRRVGFLEPTYGFFMGEKAESEIESKILCNHYRQEETKMMLDYHSSGRILYWNFSVTHNNRQDNGTFVEVSASAANQTSTVAQALARTTGYGNATAPTVTNNTTINRWGAYHLKVPSITIETTNIGTVSRSVGSMKLMDTYFAERSRVLYATLDSLIALKSSIAHRL